jgi:hypothetical protein
MELMDWLWCSDECTWGKKEPARKPSSETNTLNLRRGTRSQLSDQKGMQRKRGPTTSGHNRGLARQRRNQEAVLYS